MGSLLFFPIEVSPEEAAFGFAIRPAPDGRCAITAELRDGLLALKVRTNDGRTEYRVCDLELEELYSTASSLDELRGRFRPPRSRPLLE